MKNNRLWYKTPSTCWGEALPIGNGRLGAMVYGGVEREIIQINEETLFSGKRQVADNEFCAEHLDEIREALFKRDYLTAEQLSNEHLICKGEGAPQWNGNKLDFGAFETAGELELCFGTCERYFDYFRELDLKTGIFRNRFKIEGYDEIKFHEYKSESFIPSNEDVLLTKIITSIPEGMQFTARLRREGNVHNLLVENNDLILSAEVNGGLKFSTRARIFTNSATIERGKDYISIIGVKEATIVTAIRTSYFGFDPLVKTKEDIDKVGQKIECEYDKIKDKHKLEFMNFYERCDIDFSQGKNDDLPTDERIRIVQAGGTDIGLENLFFRYGRYLLISSSKFPGIMPNNLQGIWCKDVNPRWNCDWHLNINLQMNYWLSLTTNLAECQLPLFWLVEKLAESGRKTAKIQYGLSGWVVHTITNQWFFTSPGQQPSWGSYTGSTAWLCAHIMEHYRFEGDNEFLVKYYPVVKEAAQFYLDFLVRDPQTGYLVTSPSNSPENRFYDNDGNNVAVCFAPTMDTQLVMELFGSIIDVKHITMEEESFIEKLKYVLTQLPPMRIMKDGRLAEWIEDFEEPDPGHRHISHLYGLHPAGIISPDKTPELAEACKKTLEYRLSNGGGHTGWSSAWIGCFYARLFNGDKAQGSVKAILEKNTLNNLFDIHPPFQIDGNFGATAMMAELVLQSHNGDVRILPALPTEWKQGIAKGLRARDGITVDVTWEESELKTVTFKADRAVDINWLYGDKTFNMILDDGEEKKIVF